MWLLALKTRGRFTRRKVFSLSRFITGAQTNATTAHICYLRAKWNAPIFTFMEVQKVPSDWAQFGARLCPLTVWYRNLIVMFHSGTVIDLLFPCTSLHLIGLHANCSSWCKYCRIGRTTPPWCFITNHVMQYSMLSYSIHVLFNILYCRYCSVAEAFS